MLTNDDSDSLDVLFNALANPHRRAIVSALGSQPASIAQLAQQQKLSLPAIHRHIIVLEQAGLVQRKKVGVTNFLALNRTGLLTVQDWIFQYRAQWGTDKETLENYVARIRKDETKLKKGPKT